MKKPRKRPRALVPSALRIGHFSEFARQAHVFALPKRFRAAVAFDRERRPRWFLFDLYAFWEFLCRIDSSLAETIPDKKYFTENPVGPLIDQIESRWPFEETSKLEIKEEYERALRDIAAGRVSPLTA